jgi:hypothetical protein
MVTALGQNDGAAACLQAGQYVVEDHVVALGVGSECRIQRGHLLRTGYLLSWRRLEPRLAQFDLVRERTGGSLCLRWRS